VSSILGDRRPKLTRFARLRAACPINGNDAEIREVRRKWILTFSRVILISRRLKQCPLEDTAKSDRGRYYRDAYISGTVILYIRGTRWRRSHRPDRREMRSRVRATPVASCGRSSYLVSRYPSSRLATLSVNPHSLRRPFVP